MNNQFSDESIKSFLRNPIGLLGLLALLFDSIIGIVLSVGLDKLQNPYERLPMIWFLIIYPILVLALFACLAIFSPRHLYSPQDYGNAESFIKATEKQTQKRREKEAEEIIKEDQKNDSPNKSHDSPDSQKELTANDKVESMKQRKEKLSNSLSEAERLGLQTAENLLNIPLTPNVLFSNDGRREIEIDAFHQKDGVFTIVEIKLTKNHNWRVAVERGIQVLHRDIEYMSKNGRVIRPVLVIVTPFEEDEKDIRQYSNKLDPRVDCILAVNPQMA